MRNDMKPDICEAILSLRDKEGRITPRAVVDAARDPLSPLHALFEWDDVKAADMARLRQAQQLIRSVKIEVTVEDITFQVKAMVHDTTVEGQGYRSTVVLKSDEEHAKETMLGELRNVRGDLSNLIKLARYWGFGEPQLTRALAEVKALIEELEPEAAREAA